MYMQAPNPFFGRSIKKSPPVHIKDDFNPFKHNKVVDASQVGMFSPPFLLRNSSIYIFIQQRRYGHTPASGICSYSPLLNISLLNIRLIWLLPLLRPSHRPLMRKILQLRLQLHVVMFMLILLMVTPLKSVTRYYIYVNPRALTSLISIFIAHDAGHATSWSSGRVYACAVHAADALSSRHASSEWYALTFSDDHMMVFYICENSHLLSWDGSDAS